MNMRTGRPKRTSPDPRGRLDLHEIARLRRGGERMVCAVCLEDKDKHRDTDVSAPCDLCDRQAVYIVTIKRMGYRKLAHVFGVTPSAIQYFWKRWRYLLKKENENG